jgi:hypothetical protein
VQKGDGAWIQTILLDLLPSASLAQWLIAYVSAIHSAD